MQTVTRVDQDFDFRRVQTVTDKFIPIDKPKRRRRQNNKTMVNIYILLQVVLHDGPKKFILLEMCNIFLFRENQKKI